MVKSCIGLALVPLFTKHRRVRYTCWDREKMHRLRVGAKHHKKELVDARRVRSEMTENYCEQSTLLGYAAVAELVDALA